MCFLINNFWLQANYNRCKHEILLIKCLCTFLSLSIHKWLESKLAITKGSNLNKKHKCTSHALMPEKYGIISNNQVIITMYGSMKYNPQNNWSKDYILLAIMTKMIWANIDNNQKYQFLKVVWILHPMHWCWVKYDSLPKQFNK
jgi:hypothetical protein